MASRVESAVKRAFGVDAHCAPNDDAIREVEAERYAVLAELRELEDCRLILRIQVAGESERDGFSYALLPGFLKLSAVEEHLVGAALADPLSRLTDDQRAALVKACGEPSDAW